MRVIYTCPQCGADIQEQVIATMPPINRKVCLNCGWSYEEPRDDRVMRVQFGSDPSWDLFGSPACIGCSNNPKNGGSGICFCTLGSPKIT